MGITALGYQRRTYQDILQHKIQLCQQYFGNDIDTSELTPLGKFIRIDAYELAEIEEEAEAIYYSIFPHTATGISLDRLIKFACLSRNPATVSQFTVIFKGDEKTVVPCGFEISSESGLVFYTISDNTLIRYNFKGNVIDYDNLPSNGMVDNDVYLIQNTNDYVAWSGTTWEHLGNLGDNFDFSIPMCKATVYCYTKGTISNIEARDITIINNPEVGINSVNGIERIVDGVDEEDDVTLRKRFEAALAGAGSCNELAIASALVRIDGVSAASVITNDSDVTDEHGRPAHSFECYVSGGKGSEETIAKTIFEKKPTGIKTWGDESVTFTDEGGHERTILFSFTQPVYVALNFSIKVNATFDGKTGVDNIKALIIEHINNLGVGNNVILSSLYGVIHSVAGVVEVTNLTLSAYTKNANGEIITRECTPNVAIENTESATCEAVDIAEVVMI